MALVAAWRTLRRTAKEFGADKCPRLAAALAYYTLFAMAPLLLLVIAVAGFVWGADDTRAAVVGQLGELMGDEAARGVEEILARTQADGGRGNILAAIGGALALAFGASGVFVQLQDALNTAWGVQAARKPGLAKLVLRRFFSFAMVVALGFVLLVSLVVSAGWAAVADRLGRWDNPVFAVAFPALDFLLSLALYATVVAAVYKVIPDAKVRWRHAARGAIPVALFFTLGKFALGAYLARTGVADRFGAAAGVVVLLLWVYYSGLILFFGAELTQVVADKAGQPLEPRRGAVAVEVVPAATAHASDAHRDAPHDA